MTCTITEAQHDLWQRLIVAAVIAQETVNARARARKEAMPEVQATTPTRPVQVATYGCTLEEMQTLQVRETT